MKKDVFSKCFLFLSCFNLTIGEASAMRPHWPGMPQMPANISQPGTPKVPADFYVPPGFDPNTSIVKKMFAETLGLGFTPKTLKFYADTIRLKDNSLTPLTPEIRGKFKNLVWWYVLNWNRIEPKLICIKALPASEKESDIDDTQA